jgi:hypothetical protein
MAKNSRVVALGAALAMAALGAAQATPLDFAFTYTGTGVTATGVLVTDGVLSGGAYLVTGISGARDGVAISGLVAPGGLGADDDRLLPSAPFVDALGISYAAGGVDYNFFESIAPTPPCAGVLEISSRRPSLACGTPIRVSLSVMPAAAEIPEPASAGLLGMGVAGLLARRRRVRRTPRLARIAVFLAAA